MSRLRACALVAVVVAVGTMGAEAAGPTYPQLVRRTAPGLSPTISPDGIRIAFVRRTGEQHDLYVSSSGRVRRLTTGPFEIPGSSIGASTVASNDAGQTTVAWSRDGTRLAFDAQNASFSADCFPTA